ncbi:HpcH/HpaI aldolase family protein [Synoicihabitans lomoniglobus]|uniref:Aldolase/citrate lyase family protein n=1 Tax=Synoicihabitans lomoniglobus TaxID=2909285 RepID=A0AAF0CMY0_9BACT|nr:aldolase/citrate lyase family protein [Opitutaceae bacterium LMO-M01]WED63695.1 aldolase/citrate lyase family protein [Opitutaceae bacterium LMO-M01]
MKLRPSRVLKRLADGQLPTSLKINLADPRVIEIAGLCDVDAVWLCQEHVANDWIALENQIRAARVHNIDSLVRVSRGSYSDYIRPFESDATGIIVPHVANADEAREIVQWTRFRPIGRRALDGGNIDGKFCLTPVEDYLEHANTERLVIFQIESPEALEHVEEIAAVPGFNGILFGPGDFSHLIGKVGQLNAPEVVAARQRVGAACRANGKFAMTAGVFAPLEDLVAEGYRVINIGADVVAMSSYIQQRLHTVQDTISKLPTTLKPAAQSPYV